MNNLAYGALMLAGIVASLLYWTRVARADTRLPFVFLGGLAGAFFGAKVVYLAAEGWLHLNDPNRWMILATGKSILGGLLGGYLGVELMKRAIGYTQPTGDRFAVIVPIGIMFGRGGCILNGCCSGVVCSQLGFAVHDAQGTPRWPAAQTELTFNFAAAIFLMILRKRRRFQNQHFHIYLIAYGFFRSGHEFLRETPRILGPFSGYQIAALLVALLGIAGYLIRHSKKVTSQAVLDCGQEKSPCNSSQVSPLVSCSSPDKVV